MSAEHDNGGAHLPEMLLITGTPWCDAHLRVHTTTSSTYLGKSGAYVLENTADAKRNRILVLTLGADGHRQKLDSLRRISAGGAELVGILRGDEFRVCVDSWADVVEFLTTYAQYQWQWLVKVRI